MIRVDIWRNEGDRDEIPSSTQKVDWKIVHTSPSGEESCMAAGSANGELAAYIAANARLADFLDQVMIQRKQYVGELMRDILTLVRERRNALEEAQDDSPSSVAVAARLEEITDVLGLLREKFRKVRN